MIDRGADTASVHDASDRRKKSPQQPALWVLMDGGKVVLDAGDAILWPGDDTHALTVGRGDEAQLKLQDAAASRIHFQIEAGPSGLQFIDRESRHGTWLNGVRTAAGSVHSGDILRAGESLFMVLDDKLQYAPFTMPPTLAAAGALVGGKWPRHLVDFASRFARSGLSILLLGDTGVGKEVAAKTLHYASNRKGPFHAVNCAAIPQELAEAEFFGHVKGAFSGANGTRAGHLELADGGTLFLDEVADLPLALQAKLLRVIETQQFAPIGQSAARAVDVRFVAATCKDLDAEVEVGRFRRDLYHRICGVKLVIPALHDRVEDIPLLVASSLAELSVKYGRKVSIDAENFERAILRSYPGNVRELRQMCERSALRADADADPILVVIEGEPAPTAIVRAPPVPHEIVKTTSRSVGQEDAAVTPELAAVETALAAADGNVSHAAAALRVHRAQIYRVLREHRITAEDYRSKLDKEPTAAEPNAEAKRGPTGR